MAHINEIYGLGECIRSSVRVAQFELDDLIGRLERIPGSGFSTETLLLIRLTADADTLLALSKRIQTLHDRLAQPEQERN